MADTLYFTGQINDSLSFTGDGTADQIIATGQVAAAGPQGGQGIQGVQGNPGLTVSVNSVTQVAGNISIDTDDIPEGTNKYVSASQLSDISSNTSARHSHANKALLDTYTQTESDLADAVAKKHTPVDISGKQDTLVSGTNIKTINGSSVLGSGNMVISGGGGGGGTWGSITGTLSDQTDLNSALSAKEDVSNKSTTTTLGTSDTLYPSQKAVKTYVDAQDATNSFITSVTYVPNTTYNTNREHALGMYGSRIGMNKWRMSTRDVKHIICWGDSVSQGVGVDGKTRSMTDGLRQILANEMNEEVQEGYQPIFWVTGATAARYTRTAGWTDVLGNSASNLSPHGQVGSVTRSPNSTARSITWTRPSHVRCTSAIIYWVDDSSVTSGAKWSYSTDGGTVWTEVSTTSPGTPTLKTTTISGLDNPTDIRIRNANAAGTTHAVSPCFMGIDIRHSDYGWVVHNIGQAGAALSLPYASNSAGAVSTDRLGAWNTLFDLLQPELVIIEFSNDTVGYVSATFETAINTACSTLSAYADLVAYGFPDQSRISGGADLANVRTHTRTKVLAYNGVAIDMSARWTSTSNAQALGFMPGGFFPIHPTELGDKDIASAIGRLLRSYA